MRRSLGRRGAEEEAGRSDVIQEEGAMVGGRQVRNERINQTKQCRTETA